MFDQTPTSRIKYKKLNISINTNITRVCVCVCVQSNRKKCIQTPSTFLHYHSLFANMVKKYDKSWTVLEQIHLDNVRYLW